MGRPRSVSEATRRAIADDARATLGTPEGATRRIAARHGVSEYTARRVIDSLGLRANCEETREQTRKAAQAQSRNAAQRRAAISDELLRVAERALRDLDSDAIIYNFGGKDNTYNERRVSRPPVRDRKELLTIIGIALDKHRMLDQYDSDAARASAVDEWLRSMMGAPAEAPTDAAV